MSQQNPEQHVFRLIPAGLGNLPDHYAIDCIERLVPENFPVHIAVHRVSAGDKRNEVVYSTAHRHQDWDEVNLLLSNTSLLYAITIGDEVREVAAPASVWIPAGVDHAANVIAGEGFFVCLRFDRQAAGPA